jgi:hypothetical protein
VRSYAYLYAALNKTDLKDMTVSIIETRHPRELFSYSDLAFFFKSWYDECY